MSEQPLPQEIIDWMRERHWSEHHVEWHTVRRWDTMSPDERAAAESLGWRRAPRQEGQAGNGFDFFLMHRAMLELLRAQFPQYAGLFVGWATVPTAPNDPNDPVPSPNAGPFDPNMSAALTRLTAQIANFASEDELGLYIETRRSPTPQNPFALSADASRGIHNYLHNRFSVASSPIDMGNVGKNLGNARFWRLHGWIDGRWQAFRQAQGLLDSDPVYQSALAQEKAHLSLVPAHPHLVAAAAGPMPRAAALARMQPFSRPFEDTLALRFQRLMATTPKIQTLAELHDYLQVAIELEHFTLPLYLTAMWSLRDDVAGNAAVSGILDGVAMQEMLHMGLACNLLAGVGGHPVIAATDAVPKYPSRPPGIKLPEIGLERFSEERIRLFMTIEEPENGPIPPQPLAAAARDFPRFRTIGEFYDVIDAGLDTVNAATLPGGLQFDKTKQLALPVGRDQLFVIDSLDKAHEAIETIKVQGEGTTATQGTKHVLAHYYRFEQIVLEKLYVELPNGTWRIDPKSSLPLPPATAVHPMAPVPPGGYPNDADAEQFDKRYTGMLYKLQEAWDGGGLPAFRAAKSAMRDLSEMAPPLMTKPGGSEGNLGPAFRFIPAAAPAAPPPGGPGPAGLVAAAAAGPPGPPPPAMPAPTYARVKQILDEAVNGEDIGAHGPFWRALSRDQFVAKSIFGRKLIAQTDGGAFDPDESNLVKALEGRAPFGAELTPRPAGAIYNRMPEGYPPVPQARIDEIRVWIAAGCPDAPPAAAAPALAAAAFAGAVAAVGAAAHVAFWRDFDDWAMFHAASETRDDIDTFFAVAPLWLDFAKNPAGEPAWAQAIADNAVGQAVARLEKRMRDTVIAHYGQPVPLLTLLDSFERFGDNTLPDDPLRPRDPRHNMNGAIMWFMWSAFADACLRYGAGGGAVPVDFWQAMARAIVLGLVNDGLFRARFTVIGFSVDQAGKTAARQHVQAIADATLPSEVARRYRESGL